MKLEQCTVKHPKIAIEHPKNFTAALQDPVRGAPARIEFDTIIVDTKAVVEINRDIAKSHIEFEAEVLRMMPMPMYEEKIKNGQLMQIIRLVADGRFRLKHGNTYSPTPSREELYIILHIFAANDMEYYFIELLFFAVQNPSASFPECKETR